MSSFATDVRVYAGRIRLFSRTDWLVYGAWVGLMSGLVLTTGGFLLFGWLNGVQFPEVAWPEPLQVSPPWEGGDGRATNDPPRKRAATLEPPLPKTPR